jgi:hypothetical protein
MAALRYTNLLHELIDIAHELIDAGDEERGNAVLERARRLKETALAGQLPEGFVLRDLQNLLEHLSIDWCIIGGVALLVHGIPRNTEDIDVLVSRIPPNEFTRDSSEMQKFNFYKSKSTTGTHMILDHRRQGMCELLLADTELKRWALQTSEVGAVLGGRVRIVSALGLIALKAHAMSNKPARASRDMPDILSVIMKSKPNLSELHAVLSDEEIVLLNSQLPAKLQF